MKLDDYIYELTVPGHEHSLLAELYTMQQRGYMCDVTLIAGAGVVPAHRAILVAASTYFKQRLGPENLSPDQFNVMFEDVDMSTLAVVVQFIYTGCLKVSKDTVKPIQTFCEEVKLKEAVKMCQCYTNKNITGLQPVKEETIDSVPGHEICVTELAKDHKHSHQSKTQKGTKIKRSRTGLETNVTDSLEDRKRSLENVLDALCHDVSASNVTLNIPNLSTSTHKTLTAKPARRDKKYTSAIKTKRGRKCKSKQLPSVSKSKSASKSTVSDKTTTKKSRIKTRANQNSSESQLATSISKDDYESKDNIDVGMFNNKSFTSDDDTNADLAYEDIDNEENDKTMDDINPFTIVTVKSEQIAKLKVKKNENVTRHKKVKEEFPRNCELCNEVLVDEKTLKSHNKKHHKGKPVKRRNKSQSENWPCSVCGRLLTSAVRQACHHYSKHGIPYNEALKLHTCDVVGCKYITASKHYLQIHQKGRHGNERPHVCHFCGKGFKLPSALTTHLNIHTQSLVHRCAECDLTFNQKGGLEVHIKKHHKGEASWTELCHLCSEKFMQKAELCWHMYKTHNIPLIERYKVHSCAFCDYQTIRKNKMQRHMDAHDEKRNFTCTVCEKKFVTKSYLKRHIRYHGEKSFKCSYDGCTYCCVDQVGLNKHVRLVHTHKNYKPFVCSICPYKSGLRGNLDKHIRTVHNLEVVTKHTVQLKTKFKDRRSGDILTKDGQYIHKVFDQRGMSHLQQQEFGMAENRILGKCEPDQDHSSAGSDEAQSPTSPSPPATIIAGLPATPPPHDAVPLPPYAVPNYLYPPSQLTSGTSRQVAGPFALVPDSVASQMETPVYLNVNPMAFVDNSNKFPNYY